MFDYNTANREQKLKIRLDQEENPGEHQSFADEDHHVVHSQSPCLVYRMKFALLTI